MTQVAIVILNYNGEKLLPTFLPSVVKYSTPHTVFVADNGSTDRSVNFLRENFPQVKLIILDNNYGFCGGYNRALNQIQADVYVLLNSDVEVTPWWLDEPLKLFHLDSNISAIQPKILSYQHRNQFEYAGAGGGLIDSLGYPFCRGRIFSTVETDRGQYNDTTPVFWASGACLMIRSSVYHQFNGLDEDLFAHMEEIDLCWKIHRTANKVMYCGASTVYHLGAGTLGYNSPRKTYLNFRNNLILVFKHWSGFELLYKAPLRLLLDWLAAIQFLLKGESKNAGSIIKAHFHFFMSLSRTWLKRKQIREEYPQYSKRAIYTGSIIWQYFVKKKKSYESRSVVPDRTAFP